MIRIDVSGLDVVRHAFAKAPAEARTAASRALNDVAFEAKTKVVASLPQDFTIRTGWVAKGIRAIPAQPGKLEALVGSKDPFMERQATGGVKRSAGKRFTAVPVAARAKKTDITRPGKWPGKIKNAFLSSKVSDNVPMGLWQRYGPKVRMTSGKYAGQKRQRVRLVYSLRAEVEVTSRFELQPIAERVTRERFVSAFQMRFSEALRGGEARGLTWKGKGFKWT